jgi:hypothetical protein
MFIYECCDLEEIQEMMHCLVRTQHPVCVVAARTSFLTPVFSGTLHLVFFSLRFS